MKITKSRPATTRTNTPANRTDNGQSTLTDPVLVDFDLQTYVKLKKTAAALHITPEELIVRAMVKWLPTQETAGQAPLPTPEKITLGDAGIASGIPLPPETLALMAMRYIYMHRERIIYDVALKFSTDFIHEAHQLIEALLIVERLLTRAGIRTEDSDRIADAGLGFHGTTIETALSAITCSESYPKDVEHAELLGLVNRQFRPWIKDSKKFDAPR